MQRKSILVDLLPVLPGGSNGGAKVMIMDLLKSMIDLTDEYEWYFCVRPGVEQELAILKHPKVHCFVMDSIPFQLPFKVGRSILSILRKRSYISNYLYRAFLYILNSRYFYKVKCPHQLKFDLLFYPFTEPVFHQKNIPTVAIIYDLQYLTYPSFFEFEDLLNRKYTVQHACQKSTALVAISEYSRKRTLETQNIAQEKIKTIPICLSQRLESCLTSEDILEKYNLQAQKYFIYPANFWKHKNHEMLIVAFQLFINKVGEDVKLVLTGAPCERQSFLKEVIFRKNLESSILFLDYVSNDELAILMRNSLALVFPSLYEGFGMPVVEAMALGVPVLSSNTTSLPEVAGDAALLFDPTDLDSMVNALLLVFHNASLGASMIEKGYQQAHQFSNVERMAHEYLALFKQLIKETA